MKKIILIAILIIIAVASFKLIQTKKAQLQAMPKVEKKELVEVIMPKKQFITQQRQLNATVKSNDTIEIYAKPVEQIQYLAKEGEKVKKGQILFILQNDELKAKIAQQENALKGLQIQEQSLEFTMKTAKQSLIRAEKLFEVNALSQEELDKTRQNYLFAKTQFQAHLHTIASKKEELNSMLSTLKHYSFKAPFDGTIESVTAVVSQLNNPAKPLMHLIGPDRRLYFTFSNNAAIKQSDKILFKDKTYPFYIFEQNENYLQKGMVEIDNAAVKIGSIHPVTVLGETVEATVILKDALVQKDKGYYVYEFKNEKFSRKKVDLLFFTAQNAVIKQDLDFPVAIGAINKLSLLPIKQNLTVVGVK